MICLPNHALTGCSEDHRLASANDCQRTPFMSASPHAHSLLVLIWDFANSGDENIDT